MPRRRCRYSAFAGAPPLQAVPSTFALAQTGRDGTGQDRWGSGGEEYVRDSGEWRGGEEQRSSIEGQAAHRQQALSTSSPLCPSHQALNTQRSRPNRFQVAGGEPREEHGRRMSIGVGYSLRRGAAGRSDVSWSRSRGPWSSTIQAIHGWSDDWNLQATWPNERPDLGWAINLHRRGIAAPTQAISWSS